MPTGRKSRSAGWRTVAAAAAFASLGAGWAAGRVPLLVVGAYSVSSCVGFFLYRRDKRAAQAGANRTRERTLHLVAMLGGWPGGLLAQDRFEHKTRKAAFQVVFWATVAFNCAAIGWLLHERVPDAGPEGGPRPMSRAPEHP